MKRTVWMLALAATSTSGMAWADARAEVMAAFEAAMVKKEYRVTTTSQVNGRDYQNRIDVQLPGSFHMKGPDSEFIILPGGSWMNTAGQWMKLPTDMSRLVESFTMKAAGEAMALIRDVEQIGSETVAGCSSTNYRYRTEGKFMGVDATSKVQVSVCDDSGLPVRLISENDKGGSRTVLEYDFETPIEIRAPR